MYAAQRANCKKVFCLSTTPCTDGVEITNLTVRGDDSVAFTTGRFMHDSNPKFGHWLLEGLGTQVIDPSGLPSTIYGELRNTSLTASVKFIVQRYKAAPVKTGLKAIRVPDSENCPKCDANMKVRYRIENMFDIKIRILWECAACDRCEWRQYENGKQRAEKG